MVCPPTRLPCSCGCRGGSVRFHDSGAGEETVFVGNLPLPDHERSRTREMPMTFAPDHEVPIPYMQRTRDYYLKLGYDNPYRWAPFIDVPFTPLARPLAETRLALITTAAPYQRGVGDQGPGARYNAAAKFYTAYSDSTDSVPDLRVPHVGYHRNHTPAEAPKPCVPL